MKTKTVLAAGLFTALMSACGTHNTVNNSQTGGTSPSSDSKTLHYESLDGKVKIDKIPFTQEQLDQVRAQYRRTNLVPVGVDASYNTNVYRISDETIADYKNKAFVEPRIYSYGTQDGGRLLPISNPDGTTTLTFNVIFLDGTTRDIPRPEANGSVFTIPETFTIHDPEGLKNLLKTRYGMENGLSALPGCPKKITISAGDYVRDVTPEAFRTADYCKLNTPLPISLRVPKAVAKDILERELPMNAVSISGTFETRVSYPTSNVRVQFDRQRIYSDLKAELGIKAFFFDVDAKVAIKKVVQNQLMSVVIQGETSEYVTNLIEKVSTEFFAPFPADPTIPDSAACSSAVCVRFSLAQLNASDTMSFSFASDSNDMTGQNLLTTTTLKPTPRQVIIGDFNCDQDHRATGACNRLSSGGTPKKMGLTVYEGDEIKIDVNALVLTNYLPNRSGPVRQNNLVCVRYACETGHCESWARGLCEENVNQWTDTTTIGSPTPTIDYQAGANMQTGTLYDNLVLRFEWTDHVSLENISRECSLSLFPRVGDGQSLTVKLKNVQNCAPFNHDPNETPMISLLIRKLPNQPFNFGSEIRRWDGSVQAAPDSVLVTPQMDFEGTLTLQGLYIESDYQL